MKLLSKLLNGITIDSIIGNTNITVSSITFESKKVISSSLFIAIKGIKNNGHDYISNAILAGSNAIICEFLPTDLNKDVTYIKVSNTAHILGLIASNFYDNPSNKIKLIGITGTNGKTSIAHYLYSLFQKLNIGSGLISTIENKINKKVFPTNFTTPNSIEINRLLSLMILDGCTVCFMEVSSHGIDQNRIVGLNFDIAVFSNITRDHLDYHDSFDEYINTKKRFFDNLNPSAKSIINADDKYASRMAMDTKSKKCFYGINSHAHYTASIMESGLSGLSLTISNVRLNTVLVGDFNAYNLLAVYSVALELGQSKNVVLKLLSSIKPARGRFNIIRSNKNIVGIVDYAHTPDALKKVIKSISNFCNIHRDLILVLGCGGNRDKGKRSIMGQIAFENSNKVVFTSDNPRFENPESILNDMCIDLPNNATEKLHKIINREDAIAFAAHSAVKGSVILIAGKGHEEFQEINGIKKPFDDSQILKKFLKI